MRFAIVAALALLAGCVGLGPAEIRQLPAETYTSSASPADVVECLRTDPDSLHVGVTVLPGTGVVEFEYQTLQGTMPRVLYLARAEPAADGSSIAARFSGSSSMTITESEFRALMARCAPPLT